MKTGPKYKICRRLGDGVFAKCQTPKYQISKSKKMGPRRARGKPRTEYGHQLIEKQKVRYTYGVAERQLANYIQKARAKTRGQHGVLASLLELRLDNIAFRMGLAATRAQARQLVGHGHVCVNERRVTIPSFQCSVGDSIHVRAGSRQKPFFTDRGEFLKNYKLPAWLSHDKDMFSAKVVAVPKEGDSESLLDFGRVLEFYSRV